MASRSKVALKVLTLERWKHAAILEVELQSGAGMVRQRPGTLPDAIRGGRVPNPLVALAIRIEYEGLDPKTLSAEEVAEYEDFRDWYIAESLVEPTLLAVDVRELPAGDREQLWLGAIHAFSGALLARLASVMDLKSFREGTGGAEPGGDGALEGSAAE